MTKVPVADIAEIDVAESGQDGVTAAVESLRRDGVVILRRAVDPSTVARLQDMVEDWHSRFLAGQVENYSLGEEVTKTRMIVLPPDCLDSPFLHTDAESLADIVENPDASPVMVSAQVFLSDLPTPGMGNFTCVPGSHRQRYPWSPDNPTRSQLGGPLGQDIPMDIRRQVLANAGDAVVFIHSLWHGATSNTSPSPRRSVIVAYAKPFVRPYGYERTPQLVLDHGTRRQRLLFGDLGGWPGDRDASTTCRTATSTP